MNIPKTFSILLILLVTTYGSNAQIEIESKQVEASYYRSTSCEGYTFSAEIPVFKDSSKFIQELQDTVLSIYYGAYEDIRSIFEGSEVGIDFNFFPENHYGSNMTEDISMGYEYSMDSANILSFYINYSWHAGCGGMGATAEAYCFNINLLDSSYIELSDLFKPEMIDSIYSIMDSTIAFDFGVEPSDDYFSPQYVDFNISKKGLIIFFTYPYSGSKVFYNTTLIEWNKLNLFLKEPFKKIFE
jgi:hypothetical protein